MEKPLNEILDEIRSLIADAQEMVAESEQPFMPPLPVRFALFIERLELLARKIEKTIAYEQKQKVG